MLGDMANWDGYCKPRIRARRRKLTAIVLLGVPLLHGCPGVQVSPGGSPAAGTGTAMLTWDAPTTDTNGMPIVGLAGYHIYVGTDPNELSLRGGISGVETTDFEVSGLAPGTYYFAVSAYNVYGDESAKSNLGSKAF